MVPLRLACTYDTPLRSLSYPDPAPGLPFLARAGTSSVWLPPAKKRQRAMQQPPGSAAAHAASLAANGRSASDRQAAGLKWPYESAAV